MKIKLVLLFFLAIGLFGQNYDWKTKFEKSNFLETCDYLESIKYFSEIADFSPFAELEKFGVSPQGRDLYYLVVNKDSKFELDDIKNSKKSVVLIENGIHAGEIEGKDASMLLLRDILITKEKINLLDNVILIVIPVLNVDGHERISKFNRINQDGPVNMGWRTTAQNLNLNRDFLKADAPEMKALIKLYNAIEPDIFIDTHTTDGLDMQPVITYSIEWQGTVPLVLSDWISKKYVPYIEDYLKEKDFLSAPYFNFKDYSNPHKGVSNWVSSPKLSGGYSAIRNRIGVLIETHSLKPYKDRVYSTLSFIEGTVKLANEDNIIIKSNTKLAEKQTVDKYIKECKPFPISFKVVKDTVNYLWKGINYESKESIVAGGKVIKYTKEKYSAEIPFTPFLEADNSVMLPKYYVIPQEWKDVIEVLLLHGVKYKTVSADTNIIAQQIKFKDVKFAKNPYEGRFQPSFQYDTSTIKVKIRKGDYIFPTEQHLLGILAYLLEPNTNDSFLKWGFFNAIFEQKEYFEIYSMEPIAKMMYDENEVLRNEFNLKLKNDENFKNDQYQRLNFFYERSEYYDKKFNVYPVLKVY